MQLKIGQLGIIVKGKSCCTSDANIGRVVTYLGPAVSQTNRCILCGVITENRPEHVKISGNLISTVFVPEYFVISKYRVKWLNDGDDADLEETEEITKELTDAPF